MANKYRGEVAFPQMGEGAFISFHLADLAELEASYGDGFFGVIEAKVGSVSPATIVKCLSIGLKARDAKGEVTKCTSDDIAAAIEGWKFRYAEASKPIMDALALSWMHKTYDELLEDAAKEQKKADAARLKRAKEVADEAGVPFDEALSSGLFKLLTDLGSVQSMSGA